MPLEPGWSRNPRGSESTKGLTLVVQPWPEMKARIYGNILRRCLAAAAGMVAFAVVCRTGTLRPAWIAWLLEGDRAQSLAAWFAYRKAPWSLPLGELGTLLHPMGASLAYMDGTPWYLTLLKLLSPVLPADFQPWGLWLLLCFMLQALFARLLCEALTGNEALRWSGTIMLTFSLPLVYRLQHFSLAAHWLLLAGWWLFFAQPQSMRWWIALTVLASATHPYLCAMVLALGCAGLFDWRALRLSFEKWGGLAFSAAVTLWFFGYFQIKSVSAPGFGYFRSDLAGFLISLGTSALLPSLRALPGQNEGYAYLGLGGILACAFAALCRRGRLLRLSPLERRAFIVAGLLFLFSLGQTICLFGYGVLDVHLLYNPIHRLADTFRAHGRFIWPLYYLVLALSIAGMACRSSRKSAVLAALVVLAQAADTGPFLIDKARRARSIPKEEILRRATVKKFLRDAEAVVFIPPEPREECGFPPNSSAAALARQLLVMSSARGLPLNSTFQARIPRAGFESHCRAQLETFRREPLRRNTLYLIDRKVLKERPLPFASKYCEAAKTAVICFRPRPTTVRINSKTEPAEKSIMEGGPPVRQ